MQNNTRPENPYVNYGFQDEGRPPPYAATAGEYSHPPAYPSVPQYGPRLINTHHAPTAALPAPPAARKGVKKSRCKCLVASAVLVLLGVAAVLAWYFVSYQCLFGRSCGEGGLCLSASQWCDGQRDCPGGQDESQCLRLYGHNYLLQSYSPGSQTWKAVCADEWNNDYGRDACQQIGYNRNSYVSSGGMHPGYAGFDGFVKLNPGFRSGELMQKYLISSSCSANAAVTLRCIDCGNRTVVNGDRTRIVGGQEVTTLGVWPWQVSLQARGQHLCGGSIITPQWIVTAAHCVQTITRPDDWTVYAGYLTLDEMRSNAGNKVRYIATHDYNRETNDNDIALMKLQNPLIMSTAIKPVCLPTAGLDLAAPRECHISGWGSTSFQGSASPVLQEAKISLIDRSTCNSRQVYNGQITDTMVCAGNLEGGVDSCQGDSGGPLVTQQNSVWWLVGDTSWGEGCGYINRPGVYGNVTHFLSWIYEQMQNH